MTGRSASAPATHPQIRSDLPHAQRQPGRSGLGLAGLALIGLGLTACMAAPQAGPKPDPATARPALLEPVAAPVEIVTLPEPLPLPGQLKPLPAARPQGRPLQRVADAQRAARQEPRREGFINAIQTYPYHEGALYRLYAMPEQVSDIVLQPGESLIAVSAGDTVRWIVADTTSGAGADQRVHILVKPVLPDLQTNLVITTDRRAYHLELESTSTTYMAAVSWHYPQDTLRLLQQRNAMARQAEPAAAGLALERLRFGYTISGDNPPWRPVRAFDDGTKVYIQFPETLMQASAPPLFILGADGNAALVNYRLRGRYYIVDRLFAAAELRLGTAPQQVVRIQATTGHGAAAASLPGAAP